MLLLKRHLVELVKAGKKRQTIRLWSRPLLRAGQISFTPGLGKMRITAVDELPSLSALTESDALADGFPTLAALLAEIRRIYGPGASQSQTRRLFRIQFEYPLSPEEKPKTQPAKLKAKPASGQPPVVRKKTASSAAPSRKSKIENRKSRMSPDQRQSLRSFILARAPHRRSSKSEQSKTKN